MPLRRLLLLAARRRRKPRLMPVPLEPSEDVFKLISVKMTRSICRYKIIYSHPLLIHYNSLQVHIKISIQELDRFPDPHSILAIIKLEISELKPTRVAVASMSSILTVIYLMWPNL
jgi:hypothetical protein